MRVYRASGLGGCSKAQIANHLGFKALDTSKQMENFANEGALHEEDIVRRLRTVTRQQEEVKLNISPAFDVVGHIDGIYANENGEEFVLEVKSMGQSSWDAWMKWKWDAPGFPQKYKWQVSVYMHATRVPCRFVVKNRNTGETDTVIVEDPFYTLSEIILRVVMMERVVRKGDLPITCDARAFPCPFFYLHEVEELELAEDEVLDELAQMYEEARLDVKVAEARQKEARKALDAGMGDREKVETEKVKVTYYQRNGTKFDVKKAKETLGEKVVESLMTPTQYKGMRVTIKEDREEEPGGDAEGSGTD